MARRKPVTAEDLADLVRRCEDLSMDLYDMSDRLDGSFGDAAVRASGDGAHRPSLQRRHPFGI